MDKTIIPCKHNVLKEAKKKLGINPKNYLSISMFLDNTSEKARLSGRRVSVVVGAAIYLFCKESQGFTQKTVAEAVGITEVSVRNTMKVIYHYMPDDKKPDLRMNLNPVPA